MQVYPPPRYLSGPRIIQPDVKEVDTYLSYLNPEQARIKSISPSFSGKTDKVAKWYGTQYKTVSLPSQTKEWKSAKASDYPTLKLPAPNELIPQNFDLLVTTAKSETERIKALEEHPIVLRNDSKWLVFHKIDRYYAQPKVYAIVSLSLPSELYNAEFAINARLFSYCFYDSLSEYSYEASLGGLGYEVEFTSRGLQITFDGYNDKFDIYVRKIMNELKSFRPDQKTFERYKDILTR
jgi:insulysin